MARWLTAALSATAVIVTLPVPSLAAPPPLSVPLTSAEGSLNTAGGTTVFLGNLERSNFLLGDLFGLRTALAKAGISLAIEETSEVLGNVTGGVKRGAEYDGLTQVALQLDTGRAFGWYGGLFNVSALQIHGRSLSAENLLTLQTSSGIEADRATRLWELWYDQKFLDEDRLDIKVGQQSLDQEFIVNPNGAYFLNTMFGWPLVPSVDLPGGGPAYPLSALGVRARYRPIDPITFLVGVYNGSPSPTNQADPQLANPSGTSFALNGGTLTFVEMQYTYPAIGSMEMPGEGAPLGHTWRLGAWYDSESFADQRYDNTGLSLANPASNGNPLSRHGDYALYAVADQMVWRDAGTPNRSVSLFGRVMGTPQADRNLVDFSLNAGIVYHDPITNRPDDTLAIGMGYAHVSRRAAALDQDAASFAQGSGLNPIRTSETYVEVTYQYQVRPWWQIQPDIQYVFNPGGGIANPDNPDARVKNELVLGVRSNVLF